MSSHLFAIGGGGSCGPKGGPNRMLMEVLKTTGKRYPKICVIPTASADNRETIANFSEAFHRLNAHPNYLSLYSVPTRDLEGYVAEFDAVYICGGNTRNLIALWREWELDRILVKAWKAGLVLSGASAGANCWFEHSSSDFIPGEYNPLAGLAVLTGSFCPHYSNEKDRRESYLQMVASGALKPGYAASDRAAIHYVDGVFSEALVEWEEAAAFRVERSADGKAVEMRLPARTV